MAGADSKELVEQLQPVLQSNEEVLWAGRPNALSMMGHAFKPGLCLMLLPLAFMVFFGYMSWSDEKAPLIFKLFAVAFMPGFMVVMVAFVGVYFMGRARRTVYAVTNHRVLITISKLTLLDLLFMTKKLATFGKGEIDFIFEKSRRDGIGHIFFHGTPDPYSGAAGLFPSITGVPNAKAVAELIRKQEYAANANAPVPSLVKLASKM